MKISLQEEEEEEVKEGVVGKGNSVATFLTTLSFLRPRLRSFFCK